MDVTIINFKGSWYLKEAIRIVAFNDRKTSSAFMREFLENDPRVAKELKKLKAKKV